METIKRTPANSNQATILELEKPLRSRLATVQHIQHDTQERDEADVTAAVQVCDMRRGRHHAQLYQITDEPDGQLCSPSTQTSIVKPTPLPNQLSFSHAFDLEDFVNEILQAHRRVPGGVCTNVMRSLNADFSRMNYIINGQPCTNEKDFLLLLNSIPIYHPRWTLPASFNVVESSASKQNQGCVPMVVRDELPAARQPPVFIKSESTDAELVDGKNISTAHCDLNPSTKLESHLISFAYETKQQGPALSYYNLDFLVAMLSTQNSFAYMFELITSVMHLQEPLILRQDGRMSISIDCPKVISSDALSTSHPDKINIHADPNFHKVIRSECDSGNSQTSQYTGFSSQPALRLVFKGEFSVTNINDSMNVASISAETCIDLFQPRGLIVWKIKDNE